LPCAGARRTGSSLGAIPIFLCAELALMPLLNDFFRPVAVLTDEDGGWKLFGFDHVFQGALGNVEEFADGGLFE